MRAKLPEDLQVAVAIEHTYARRGQSEILTLNRGHLDLKAGTLRLDPGRTKNDEGRVVYLTPEIATLLEGQLARVEALQKQTGVIVPYLFPRLAGKKHRGQRIRDFRCGWRTACEKAGAPGTLRHDFRRTAGRTMVKAGVVERVAMTVTGHKTRAVLDGYHSEPARSAGGRAEAGGHNPPDITSARRAASSPPMSPAISTAFWWSETGAPPPPSRA